MYSFDMLLLVACVLSVFENEVQLQLCPLKRILRLCFTEILFSWPLQSSGALVTGSCSQSEHQYNVSAEYNFSWLKIMICQWCYAYVSLLTGHRLIISALSILLSQSL